MGVMVYTNACQNCGSATRIEVIGQAVVLPINRMTFHCPCCGSTKTNRKYVNGMDDDEYFYWLASDLGLPRTSKAAALVKTIFATWDTEEFASFKDYYKSFEEGEE